MLTIKREYPSDKTTGILTMPDELQQDIASVRSEGYTFDVTPFKDRSIPSIRPRFKIK